MKKRLVLLLIFTTLSCINTQSNLNKTQKATVYYLIRHAEKDKSNPKNKNPDLIERGQKRAENWSNYFEKIELDAVYSTNYSRTIKTAAPTARAKNLQITSYNPQTIDIKMFLEKTIGQRILIVGHSNTTPDIVNKIIGENKYQSIDETINNKLYIITITDEKIKHELKSVD